MHTKNKQNFIVSNNTFALHHAEFCSLAVCSMRASVSNKWVLLGATPETFNIKVETDSLLEEKYYEVETNDTTVKNKAIWNISET